MEDPKGKAKLEVSPASGRIAVATDAAVNEARETCGICLSDDGRSVRGWIDSCDHYYCFVCIMEWAKVESRCPMCKLRFRTILRPPIRGLFPRERLVHVPLRDQVYHPLGNESTRLSDRYENVRCSECHTSADDELLLLCDLCDSAAHTYCVGLGATVPEGDWYCHDCTISRDEHSKVQSDADYHEQDAYKKLSMTQEVDPSISILEILADGDVFDTSIRLSGIQNLEEITYESHPARVDASHSEARDQLERLSSPAAPVSGAFSSSEETIAEQGARTLHQCRNLQDRIRILRDNWHALRAGSLYFPSMLCSNVGATSAKIESASEMISDKSRQIKSSSSDNSEQSALVACTSSKTARKRNTQDVDKAWKMMKVAKSIQEAQNGLSSGNSLCASGKSILSKQTKAPCASASISKGNISSCKFSSSPELLQAFRGSFVERRYKGESSKTRKLDKWKTEFMQEPVQNTSLPQDNAKEDISSFRYIFNQKESLAPQKDLQKVCTLGDKPDVASYADTEHSLPGASNLSSRNTKSEESPFGAMDAHSARIGAGTTSGGSSMTRNEKARDNPKAEVQYLVKVNLKLLSREMHLGADRFKEVARIATHTILAACGLEHSKSAARKFSGPFCRHTEQAKQLRKCNLMPSSCRKCFFNFVKDVVNSIIYERKHSYREHI